jgi:hypothetical protein
LGKRGRSSAKAESPAGAGPSAWACTSQTSL